MKITCTRRLQFCAGHRVVGHENKCAHLHGHNYIAHITANSLQGKDNLGRVIDFSVLKKIIGKWIDDNWDHGFILYNDDFEARQVIKQFKPRDGVHQKLYLMPCNPTAENLAEHLIDIGNSLIKESGVSIISVTIEETENCSATVTALSRANLTWNRK